MADEPEQLDEELLRLRERRHLSRCNRTYSLLLEGLGPATGLPPAAAQRAFISVLCALQPPLPRDLTAEWRAQLPVKWQEALRACAPRRDPAQAQPDLEALLRRVEADIGAERARAESVTRAILSTLRAHITEGEAEQVAEALPAEFRALWGRAC
jgi:uncharacterized protein (DUF2267 family)